MTKFIKRTSFPKVTDKNFLHYSKGGYNYCIKIDSKTGFCLHNCVGYAWGRWRELLGSKPKLSRANAELWYKYTSDGYKRGKTPKVGAVACWEGKGSLAGHVAIVEEVKSDGSIVTSNDGYGTKKFWLQTTQKPYNIGSKFIFQGFIYPPIEFESPGIYKVVVSKYLRKTHKLGNNFVKVKETTTAMRNALTSTSPNAKAKIKVGRKITILEVYTDSENRVWGRNYSGWVVLCNKDGSPQMEKV